jgi:hypothetical protein
MTGRPSFPVTTVDDCSIGAPPCPAGAAVAGLWVLAVGGGGGRGKDEEAVLRYERDDVEGNDE